MPEPVPPPARPGVPLDQLHQVFLALAAFHDGADFAFEEVPERLTDMIEACRRTLVALEPIRPTVGPIRER